MATLIDKVCMRDVGAPASSPQPPARSRSTGSTRPHGGSHSQDIVRTDRDVEFFAGDGNPNIEKLGRILGIFSMLHRPDMPYVQVLCCTCTAYTVSV
jgi:hypothetical protein